MAQVLSITNALSIAMHGIVVIIKADKQLLKSEIIAKIIGYSKFHVAKVLQNLSKADILYSTKGPSGGFKISRPLNKITLLDIYEAVEGKIVVRQCPVGRQECMFGECVFGPSAKKVTESMVKELKTKTLETYIKRVKWEFKDL